MSKNSIRKHWPLLPDERMMGMAIQQYKEGLLTALSNHYHTYQNLYKLSKKQNNFLKDKKMDSLFETHPKKENLVESLKLSEKEINNYQKNWNDFRDNLSFEDHQEVQKVLENIQFVVKNLLAMENENKKLLENQKNEVKSRLSKISTNKRNIKKYILQEQLYKQEKMQ